MATNKKTLVATAYDEIYRRIITLEYEPGIQLNEQGLIKDLSIGRTPIREALVNLNSDMLVESLPNRGVIVRPITLQNTKAAFAALKILELGVAEQTVRNEVKAHLQRMEKANTKMENAVKEMDIFALVDTNNTFHTHFAHCSENIYLVEALRKVRCETNRLAYLSFANEIDPKRSLNDHYKHIIEQHDVIIRCIRERNLVELKDVLNQHIIDFKNRIIQYLAN